MLNDSKAISEGGFYSNYGTCTSNLDGKTEKRGLSLSFSTESFFNTLLCQRDLKAGAKKKKFIQFIKYIIRLLIFLIFFGVSSMIGKIMTMVVVVPRVDVHAPPAPDVLLDIFSHAHHNAFKATEIITAILFCMLVIISLVHSKERAYILDRFLFISGTLINLRTLCISITTFSIPTKELSHQCSKLQTLPRDLLLLKSINIFEFSETCGDYVFSGHATALIVAAWFVWYYGRSVSLISSKFPSALMKLMNFLLLSLVIIGCLCILFAKEHYSVDVVLGGVISLMFCSLYHLLVEGYRKQCEDKLSRNNVEKKEQCSVDFCVQLWFRMVEGHWNDNGQESEVDSV